LTQKFNKKKEEKNVTKQKDLTEVAFDDEDDLYRDTYDLRPHG